MDDKTSFFIDDVHVLPSKNQFVRGDACVTVQPKVMGVLQYLAKHQDRVVSAEELISELWSGRVVSYGTVPKCITSLRKGLGQLLGDVEIVANYSKKGYQLLIPPKYSRDEVSLEVKLSQPSAEKSGAVVTNWTLLGAALCLLLCVGVVVWWWTSPSYHLEKKHKTVFAERRGYTNETGLERVAEPHPDNQHVAYIRDNVDLTNLEQISSRLVVRNKEGREWDVDEIPGMWFLLEWAPDQSQLLAAEVRRSRNKLLTKNFYEAADYYYAIYVYDLDLAKGSMRNKKLVSRWQGRLFSASWWNDSVIEVVARQGVNGTNKRYRIDLANNNAAVEIRSPSSTLTPLASAVNNGMTAVAYDNEHKALIEIYDSDAKLVTRSKVEADQVNLSWIPDGTGVLVFADYEALFAIYLDGEIQKIDFLKYKDHVAYRPRFSPDGQSIYMTEKKLKSNIWNYGLEGENKQITENDTYNFKPQYSANGEKILYASVRNNQIQIWLIVDGKEKQIVEVEAEKIRDIVWLEGDEQFLYRADDEIFIYDFVKNISRKLLGGAKYIQPVDWRDTDKQLVVIKRSDNQANIWHLWPESKKEIQITFGSVGAAIALDDSVYFQYENKPGLWVSRPDQEEPVMLSDSFPKNAKILQVTAEGVFYIVGGGCRESDVFLFEFATKTITPYQERNIPFIATGDFHNLKGSLGRQCYVAETNIIEYK
ncbi:winged helix-turn-helix domain-containing protein [Teredinibacter sp. KSP-S5-2]|uniref:winged helix-turn-helix domain-containing protein n=1 Tax=Teredinibacter sp. KSP-S5-2 TaxID=3034506 RepID=UPI0029348A59|nr:winged helix-turn-helix domain-containing protein [Teredinibacter sp. KSP-S5-2]WNO08626.1 winged helix-turn-helix domain-containing protein [Teredinibacter sp. KSP-S5-2]